MTYRNSNTISLYIIIHLNTTMMFTFNLWNKLWSFFLCWLHNSFFGPNVNLCAPGKALVVVLDVFYIKSQAFYNRFTIINMQGMFQEIFSQENILNKYLRLFTIGKILLSCKQMVTYVCVIPGWVAFPFSRGSSQPRNRT